MSEKDRVCYFLESLNSSARTKSLRSRIQDVGTAMIAAEWRNNHESFSKCKSLPSNNDENSAFSGGKAHKDGQELKWGSGTSTQSLLFPISLIS
ncbi:hypothetical protein CCACVL1_20251 [Corchorus capsularis]|uniref:Uncharacterized protein n=1 Tax=Corchorus capsularis TaxID=210143 RepID=A0A1R3HBZ6_COCAP|nr:hypothetical protein CCACVL1_20251 [Corchorus capsularis]